jgi:hypothetical protein
MVPAMLRIIAKRPPRRPVLAGARSVIANHAMGLPVLRTLMRRGSG